MPYKIKELYTKWNFPVEPVNILEDVHFKDVKSSNVPNDFDDYCSLFAFLPSMSRPPSPPNLNSCAVTEAGKELAGLYLNTHLNQIKCRLDA